MLKYIKSYEGIENKDTRTTKEKVKALRKLGINVTVLDRNRPYKNWLILKVLRIKEIFKNILTSNK